MTNRSLSWVRSLLLGWFHASTLPMYVVSRSFQGRFPRQGVGRGWRLQQMLNHLQNPDTKQTWAKSDTQWPTTSTAHRSDSQDFQPLAAAVSKTFVGSLTAAPGRSAIWRAPCGDAMSQFPSPPLIAPLPVSWLTSPFPTTCAVSAALGLPGDQVQDNRGHCGNKQKVSCHHCGTG